MKIELSPCSGTEEERALFEDLAQSETIFDLIDKIIEKQTKMSLQYCSVTIRTLVKNYTYEIMWNSISNKGEAQKAEAAIRKLPKEYWTIPSSYLYLKVDELNQKLSICTNGEGN